MVIRAGSHVPQLYAERVREDMIREQAIDLKMRRMNGYNKENNMQNDQMGEALDLVMREIDKVAMCKRGIIEDECNDNYYYWDNKTKKIPQLSIKAREKLFVKHRKGLLKLLKFRSSHDLVYMNRIGGSDLYTEESLKVYQDAVHTLVKHPDADEVRLYNSNLSKRRGLVREQKVARMGAIEARIKELKMAFITEKIKMKEFPNELAKLEAEDF